MRGLVFASAFMCAAPVHAATVVVGVPGWPSAQVTAHVLGQLMESELGVSAMLRPIGTTELVGAIDRGEIDVHPELWLPNLQTEVSALTGPSGTLTLSSNQVTATQNICTTRDTVELTGLNAVADLADPAMALWFDTNGDGRGEIWIGDFEWSSTRIERARARSYGYDETMMLLTMEEDVAMAGLDVAVATGRPIVFYCYSPHYLFALHDVVRLEEPAHDAAKWSVKTPQEEPAWLSKAEAAMAWPSSTYQLAYASELAADMPNVAAFLERVTIDAASAEAMSYAIDVERRNPAEVAAEWIANNQDLVSEWTQ